MSPKVQALIFIVGLITLLAAHAQEELSDNIESERGCSGAYKRCSSSQRCCEGRPCVCSAINSNCKCRKTYTELFKEYFEK
uniref:U19-lycotoxin-Ls1a n=1 Tax=Lycosa singoriensis TaxID=434756 RepID=TXJ05_LYCSI|nr:RecName: Full=U19-lycotoxin-Ls1a; Short=U19-LCTX-Ls1a; AltName: Full=Toxin-like structure LSTX-P5; Flags: Precursor [Lycosa singoriensis]ACI41472.1 toxin-like structure LSTX-P5 precursor [Lycosa singoriensis]CAS03741.1 toxin-like structure LSTX-P5 precursor [Lycosa singoriensis]